MVKFSPDDQFTGKQAYRPRGNNFLSGGGGTKKKKPWANLFRRKLELSKQEYTSIMIYRVSIVAIIIVLLYALITLGLIPNWNRLTSFIDSLLGNPST